MAVEEEARIYLNFIARGTTESGKSVSDVGKRAAEAGVQVKGLQERMQVMGQTGSRALGLLTGPVGFGMLGTSLAAFVKSGMAGTVEAERLSLALGRIRLAGASAFAPWIRDVVNWVERLSLSLQNMSGETQESIRQWVKLGATLSTTLFILPRVVAGATALAVAVRAVGTGAAVGAGSQMAARLAGGTGAAAAAAAGAKAAGLGAAAGGAGAARAGGMVGMAGPWGAAAVGVVALLSASKEGREALNKLALAVQPLFDAFGRLVGILVNAVGPALITFSELLAQGLPQQPSELPSWIPGGPTLAPDLTPGAVRAAKEAQEAAKKRKDELALAGTGAMEDPKAIYARLAMAATKQGATPAEKTEKNTFDMKKSLENIQKFMEELGRLFGKQPPDQP